MEDNKKLSPSKEKPGKYRVIEIVKIPLTTL